MSRLDGKIALITGAARGQGAAETRLFAREGAFVYCTDVLSEEGHALAAETGATFKYLDVTSEAQWREVVDAIIADHGRIDILVNNAGIFRLGRLVDTASEDYERIIAVNQFGVFFGMQTVAKYMCDAKSGAIVNISSLAGLEGTNGAFAYTASKWAVRGMSKSAAQELGRYGIRVNSVHPGMIDTDMFHQTPAIVGNKLDLALKSVPLRRVGNASEVAELVLFLASDASAYISGGEFAIDGGMHR